MTRNEREPLWREEFSVSKADERYVNRRQLAKFLTLASLGMFAGNAWILVRGWLKKTPVYPRTVIAIADELAVGEVKLFQYPKAGDQCILVRTARDAYVAYSQKCTHLSCSVYYSRGENRLECPCHNGSFSIDDGSVLAGPPTRPLPKVVLQRHGPELIAIRMEPQV